jgi:hypothetical protein
MPDPSDIKTLQKYRRQSIQALPIAIAMLVLVAVTLAIVNHFWSVSTWLIVLLVGISAFPVLGDLVNILYLARKLRHLKE